MKPTENNVREFKEKVAEYILEATTTLSKIDDLCSYFEDKTDGGRNVDWFNDYLLQPYEGNADAYPFSMDFLEQISAMYEWRDSILESIEE